MKKIIAFIALAFLVFLLLSSFWNNQLDPVSREGVEKTFVIQKGEGLSSIAKRLKKDKLIKSDKAFAFYIKQEGLSEKIQSGTFKLSQSMRAKDIAGILIQNPEDVWLTLIEGWRVEEMADKLNEQLTIDKGQFLKLAKEGYMFPDTYLFPKDYSPEQIAKTMMDNFEKKYTPEIREKIKSLGLTEKEGVILASIVEREGRSQEVRRMIASILLKRLKIGMGLNADATIQYALGYQKEENPPAGGWWKRHLTREDLKIDSPYNTYIHSGLPPTPIANPSLSSLKAVADADPSTPYLYYYHDSKGNSHYGKTLDEHNANVANNP